MAYNYRQQFLAQLKSALSDALNAEKQISGTAASVDPQIAGRAIKQAAATDLGYLAVANPLQMPDLQAPAQIVNAPTVSQTYQQRVGPSALEQRVYPGEYMPGSTIRTSVNTPIEQGISKADWLLGRASRPVQIAGLLPTKASVMAGQASEPVVLNRPADRIIEALGERLGINPYAPASQRIYQNPLRQSIFNQIRFTNPANATGNYNEGYRFDSARRSNYDSEYNTGLARIEQETGYQTNSRGNAQGFSDSTPAQRVNVEVLPPTIQPAQAVRLGQPITIDVNAETIPDQNFVRTGGSQPEYYGPTRRVTPDTVNAAAPTSGNRLLATTSNALGYEFADSKEFTPPKEIVSKNFLEQALYERSQPRSIISANSANSVPNSDAKPYYTSESVVNSRTVANPIDLNEIDMSRLGNSNIRSVDPATVSISQAAAPANVTSRVNDFIGNTEARKVVADVLGAEPSTRTKLAGSLGGQTIDVEARSIAEPTMSDKVRSILGSLGESASAPVRSMDAQIDSILNKIAMERPAISFEVGNQVRSAPAQLPPSSRPVTPIEGVTGRYSHVSGYEQVPDTVRNSYDQMAMRRPMDGSYSAGSGKWARLAGLGAGLAGGAGLLLTTPQEGEWERSMENKQNTIAKLTTALNEYATRGSDVSAAQVGLHSVPVVRGSLSGSKYVGQGTAEDAKRYLLREALAYLGGTNAIQQPAYLGAP